MLKTYLILANCSSKLDTVAERITLAKLEDRDGKFFVVSNDGKSEVEIDLETPKDIDRFFYFATQQISTTPAKTYSNEQVR